ncbi:MAG: beta-galactosidase trimerization domain-containing protein, partial [Candidatus Hydrogenedentes bacterium]|nr:beta-galactosidase trimerization domain-containing protein [Candidatus Hydrogenedentota bacterium]
PSPLYGGSAADHAINRGNDWFLADGLDGIGCSSFPKWSEMDDADFGVRLELVKSAARDKRVWLSEVQGGRAATGFNVFEPVTARSQQRWFWNGIACGADTIIVWCWRDEVFGRESAGFGLAGDDGFAEDRLAAMKVTGRLVEEHGGLIARYRPVKPEVGLMFSPQSYYLNWAQEGDANLSVQALLGYARSLVRKSIPFLVVEEEHLDALSGLKILFLPRTIVTDERTEKALAAFVSEGGTLVCESECGAYNPQGLYRYPADRFTSRASGIREVGRRKLDGDSIKAKIGGYDLNLRVTQWLTPWQRGEGEVLADGEGGALMVEVPVGKGKLILCGAYLGDAYLQNWTADFEKFVELLVRQAGWEPDIEALSPIPEGDSFVYVKSGDSAGKKVVFVFLPAGGDAVHLRFRRNFFPAGRAKDLISGKDIVVSDAGSWQECTFDATEWRFSVLVET